MNHHLIVIQPAHHSMATIHPWQHLAAHRSLVEETLPGNGVARVYVGWFNLTKTLVITTVVTLTRRAVPLITDSSPGFAMLKRWLRTVGWVYPCIAGLFVTATFVGCTLYLVASLLGC